MVRYLENPAPIQETLITLITQITQITLTRILLTKDKNDTNRCLN